MRSKDFHFWSPMKLVVAGNINSHVIILLQHYTRILQYQLLCFTFYFCSCSFTFIFVILYVTFACCQSTSKSNYVQNWCCIFNLKISSLNYKRWHLNILISYCLLARIVHISLELCRLSWSYILYSLTLEWTIGCRTTHNIVMVTITVMLEHGIIRAHFLLVVVKI